MNHGYRFDQENAADRKRRIKEQEKRNRQNYRINRIVYELQCHPRKIASIERVLKIGD